MSAAKTLVVALGALVAAGQMSAQNAGDRMLASHVLNRLAFGPRPGDVDRVVAMGVDRWIEQQLRGEQIQDLSAAKALVGCAFWTDPIANVANHLSGPIMSQMQR